MKPTPRRHPNYLEDPTYLHDLARMSLKAVKIKHGGSCETHQKNRDIFGLGPPPRKPSTPRKDLPWHGRLGKESDRSIAADLGIPVGNVQGARKRRQIPAFRRPSERGVTTTADAPAPVVKPAPVLRAAPPPVVVPAETPGARLQMFQRLAAPPKCPVPAPPPRVRSTGEPPCCTGWRRYGTCWCGGVVGGRLVVAA